MYVHTKVCTPTCVHVHASIKVYVVLRLCKRIGAAFAEKCLYLYTYLRRTFLVCLTVASLSILNFLFLTCNS